MDDATTIDRGSDRTARANDEAERDRLEALRARPQTTARSPNAEKPTGPVKAAPDEAQDRQTEEAAAPPAAKRRKLIRPLLFLVLPVALCVGGYFYVTGGQVMSSDNAYVEADTVGISTDVAGTVVSISVHDNEVVKKGQVLFQLRQEPFAIALAGAKAQLGTMRNQILTQKATYQQSLAEIEQAEAQIAYYETAFQRQQDLAAKGAASRADFDQANLNLIGARQKVAVSKAQAATSLAELGNDANRPVEEYPAYQQAKATVDDDQRQLDDTVVKAPFDGIVTNVPSLQVGSYLNAAQQAFNLVSSTDVWVTASPKETELTYVKTAQPVTVTVDTYPGVEWKGKVGSISPASGSSFSLLPAQNTTGNWVKVVQRIPMIVTFDDLADKPPLRVGMSVTVNVDTGHARGLPAFISDLIGGKPDKTHG